MKKKILLVEDDAKMREIIADYLEAEGFTALETDNGENVLTLMKIENPDLIILDIMLPRLDGWSVCRKIRSFSDIPIIILTARSQEEDRLLGFELGADDYVTKPFSPRELVARIKALFKRVHDKNLSSTGFLQVGPIKIDRLSHQVFLNGEEIYLSPKEYELLLYLINNAEIVLSREQLLAGVWGCSYYGNVRTVDTHINRLREKLGSFADLIQTVRGFGYKFSSISLKERKP
ncbi:DNA-binding response regulator, OmpR family, contains REC and winged-helix (wHTH) domain [Thermosyntropha lipolytica DSM 11003]|uniref:Stage 0 sporulation protein A homolog n=1 Tax=Thermosyntropha lipolytica DSM 11003 TaxID=1123382 RepID=A0A1M5LWG2_9FIRM|nr:response regulator transcription factor [Thermosyntropha lipolytica]SHG69351.1 DNA-binding response regulator, OmpR family, contains REC and winged-helix (wHTH) domain [Thermosyntropha lipolytica DSM 11003]